ncbi:MAG: IPT/TIG domain-containing protein [Polyangiaceae bacterium]
MRTWRLPLCVAGGMALAAWTVPACLSRADAPFSRQTDRDATAGMSGINLQDGTSDAGIALPPTAPHAVLNVAPPHGSFAGGGLALVRGNGFSSGARVWFGNVELDSSAVVAIDPQRIQVTVPAGHAGAVDVSVQNGDDATTRASLSGGYSYDQFYADPAGGPTSGGTVITLKGDGTQWDADTTVAIDQVDCPVTAHVSPTELTCTVPPGTAGSKPIRMTTKDGVALAVLDGYVYGNSDNGFKGGLSGSALDGSLKVIVLDNATGLALADATVVVGDDITSADILKTDLSGVALDTNAGLGPKRTVTVARKCYAPQTFVAVTVDTVTAFIDPILSPACGAKGDLPPSGGSGSSGAAVTGQVVWPPTAEFRRAGWLHVPPPKSDAEQLVAYVLHLSSDPTAPFTLPDVSEAITPSSTGDRGYAFNSYGQPGNFTLYALAGIENTSLVPPTFTAYQMGLVRGVAAQAGQTKDNVFIEVDVDLDHTLTLELSPPSVTARGPNRMQASVSIQVGNEGFAPLPNGSISRTLPLAGDLSFVGVPTLTGSLLGTSYIATAGAVTGDVGGTPRSVVGFVSAKTTSNPLVLDQFVQVPSLTTPLPNAAWNGTALASKRAPGGAPVDLVVYSIASAGGLVNWTVVAPESSEAFNLPDVNALSPELGIRHGSLTITVSAAHISNFSYGALRYRDTTQRGWTAYATDVFSANY